MGEVDLGKERKGKCVWWEAFELDVGEGVVWGEEELEVGTHCW